MLDGTKYVECSCDSDEHTLRFILDFDDENDSIHPVIYTSLYLNQYRPWYMRIWISIKYIFGYHCKYGHWDCTTLGPRNVSQLSDIINEYNSGVFERRLKKLIEKSDDRKS